MIYLISIFLLFAQGAFAKEVNTKPLDQEFKQIYVSTSPFSYIVGHFNAGVQIPFTYFGDQHFTIGLKATWLTPGKDRGNIGDVGGPNPGETKVIGQELREKGYSIGLQLGYLISLYQTIDRTAFLQLRFALYRVHINELQNVLTCTDSFNNCVSSDVDVPVYGFAHELMLVGHIGFNKVGVEIGIGSSSGAASGFSTLTPKQHTQCEINVGYSFF